MPLLRISQVTLSAAIVTAIGIACLFDPVTMKFGLIAIAVAVYGWLSVKLKDIFSHDAEAEEPDRWA